MWKLIRISSFPWVLKFVIDKYILPIVRVTVSDTAKKLMYIENDFFRLCRCSITWNWMRMEEQGKLGNKNK